MMNFNEFFFHPLFSTPVHKIIDGISRRDGSKYIVQYYRAEQIEA